jgi:hypothetical protein
LWSVRRVIGARAAGDVEPVFRYPVLDAAVPDADVIGRDRRAFAQPPNAGLVQAYDRTATGGRPCGRIWDPRPAPYADNLTRRHPAAAQVCRDGAGRRYACGRVAVRALAAATAGRTVACTRLERDRYDRQVALCAADGRDLGEAMVRGGLAVELPEYSQGRYSAAEHEARAARRGLWAGTFERPADWRRGR